MGANPLPIVILSAHVSKGSERAAEALAAGALDIVAKENLRLDLRDDVWAQAMRSRLRRLSKHRGSSRPSPLPSRLRRAEADRALAHVARGRIGVGASTGGPPALEAMLSPSCAPTYSDACCVVVQHMARGIHRRAAREWLDQKLRDRRYASPARASRAGPGRIGSRPTTRTCVLERVDAVRPGSRHALGAPAVVGRACCGASHESPVRHGGRASFSPVWARTERAGRAAIQRAGGLDDRPGRGNVGDLRDAAGCRGIRCRDRVAAPRHRSAFRRRSARSGSRR